MNVFEELSSLARPELDDAASERIRGAAHAVLARARKRRESSIGTRLSRAWNSHLEPAFVLASGASVLLWAAIAVLLN